MAEPLHALDMNEECCNDITSLCPQESCAYLLMGKCMEAIYLLDKKYYPTMNGTIIQVSWHPVGHPNPDYEEHRRCLLSPHCELTVCRAQDATVRHCDPEILPHICPATTGLPAMPATTVLPARSAENAHSGQNHPSGVWPGDTHNTAVLTGSNTHDASGSQNNPAGSHFVPGGHNVHSGSQNVPPGSQNVPPGSQNVPPGSQNVQPGPQNVLPGPQNVPPESQNGASGSQFVPGSQNAQNIPAGSENVPGHNLQNVPPSQVGPQSGNSAHVGGLNVPNMRQNVVPNNSSSAQNGQYPNMVPPNVVQSNNPSKVEGNNPAATQQPNRNNPMNAVSTESIIPQQNNARLNGQLLPNAGHANGQIRVRTSTTSPVTGRQNKNGVLSFSTANPALGGKTKNLPSNWGQQELNGQGTSDQNSVVRGLQPQLAIDGLLNSSGTTGSRGMVTQPGLVGDSPADYRGIDVRILAGGIVGGALLALMMVCLTVCCVKRRRGGKSSSASTTSSHRGLHLQYSGFPLDSDILNDPVYKSSMKSATPPPPVPYRPPSTNTAYGTSFREPSNFVLTAGGISFGEETSESNDYEELPCDLEPSAKEAYDELVESRRKPNSRTPSNVSAISQVKHNKIRSVPTLYAVNRRNAPKVVQRNSSACAARESAFRNSIRPQLPLPACPVESVPSSARSSSKDYEPLNFVESASGYEVPVSPGAAGQLAMLGVMHYPVTSAMYDVGTLKSGAPGLSNSVSKQSTTPSVNQHYFVLEPQSGDGVVTISNGDCLSASRSGSRSGSQAGSQAGSQIYSPPSDHSYASVGGHEYLDLQRKGGSWHSVCSASLNPDIRL